MKKYSRIFTVMSLVVCLIFALACPIQAQAATKSKYKDVKKSTTGYTQIVKLEKMGAWKHLAKKDKFYPRKEMTKAQVITVLCDLYGEKNVPVTKKDVQNSKKIATMKWTCNKISAVMKTRGTPLGKWSNIPKCTLKRYNFARVLCSVMDLGKDYKP